MAAPAPLYLDAARLGAMSPSAQLAARDFARLAGEGLSTLYWEEFFCHGSPVADRRRPLSGLQGWTGLPGIRDLVRHLLAAPPASPVLLAARTTALVQSAVRLLSQRCRRVLTTDSLWPAYRTLLETECRQQRVPVTVVPVRDALPRSRMSGVALVRRLADRYAADQCDGLFLSSVSHDGLRLPVPRLLAAVRETQPLRLAVIDGAQELAHVPIELSQSPCDIYTAGCHKWVGAYQPLGVAVLPNCRTAPELLAALQTQPIEDPLFQYLAGLEGAGPAVETVNLTPVVTAWGALRDFQSGRRSCVVRFRQRIRNAERVRASTPAVGWMAESRSAGLHTGIVLLRRHNRGLAELSPQQLQQEFAAAGITLTAYHDQSLRLSLPARRLGTDEWGTLWRALRECGAARRFIPQMAGG